MKRRKREELAYWVGLGGNVLQGLGQLYGMYGQLQQQRRDAQAPDIYAGWREGIVDPSTATPAGVEQATMNGVTIPMQTFDVQRPQPRDPGAADIADLYQQYMAAGVSPDVASRFVQPEEYRVRAADDTANREWQQQERALQQEDRMLARADRMDQLERQALQDRQAQAAQLANLYLQHGNMRLNPDPRAIGALAEGLQTGNLPTSVQNPRYAFGTGPNIVGPELNTIPVFEPDESQMYTFGQPYILDGQTVVPRYDKRTGTVTVVPVSGAGVKMPTKKTSKTGGSKNPYGDPKK